MNIDKQDEIDKLMLLLKVPIDNLVYKPDSVEEIIGGYVTLMFTPHLIGNLRYDYRGDVIYYDANAESVRDLNWHQIYIHYEDEINELISKRLPGTEKAQIKFTPVNFRRLSVSQFTGEFYGVFECIYDDGKWRVSRET